MRIGKPVCLIVGVKRRDDFKISTLSIHSICLLHKKRHISILSLTFTQSLHIIHNRLMHECC